LPAACFLIAAAIVTLPFPRPTAAQSLADRLKAVQSGKKENSLKPALPAWKPVSSATSSQQIPVVKGLVVVTAVNDPMGDYESIKTVQSLSSSSLSLGYSADKSGPKTGNAAPASQRISGVRIIDMQDLGNAHGYSEVFSSAQEHFPGTTAISASTEVLNQLRAGQQVDFQFVASGFADMFGLGALMNGGKSGSTIRNKNGQSMSACKLHRVEPTDLSAPVLVNDARVELPALHARCVINDDDEVNFYFLDQPSNPISLAFHLGSVAGSLQAIKISFPQPEQPKNPSPGSGKGGNGSGAGGGGTPNIEQALANKKPVEVYGIYFDFNSSTIKPESEAVLREISDIMHKNPTWKLSIAGHTDNIGDNNFNQGLSERRAAAVKDALVNQYKIAADRLTTSGYGESRPIETNGTMEGRARNRRVELQRQ
jgi:outer membrane protein OmpA-like peptidoglycan-associated protein